MKLLFLIIIFVVSYPVFSAKRILGEFTTVSESECNSKIQFFKNGKGLFIDSCRRKDGSYIGKIYSDEISWTISNKILLVKINGLDEVFSYYNKLSCHYFGESGDSSGLIGLDLYFWRNPVKCN